MYVFVLNSSVDLLSGRVKLVQFADTISSGSWKSNDSKVLRFSGGVITSGSGMRRHDWR